MIAPALPQITEQFGLEPGSVLEAMTLSVFVLAYAIGPLLLVSSFNIIIFHSFAAHPGAMIGPFE